MNYAYLSNNYAAYKWFGNLVDNHEFIPIIVMDNKLKKMQLTNEIIIDLKSANSNIQLNNNIDYDFILEYYFKRFSKNEVINNFFPKVQLLITKLLDIIKEDDVLISSNSGTWGSRTLHEICRLKKANFFYHETFFFNEMHHISYKPFMYSIKYKKPELNDIFNFSKYNEDDIKFLDNYINSNKSKYEQSKFKLDGHFDYFVVGQMPFDTNVVIPAKIYKTAEELCYFRASKSSKKFIYKKHPKLENLNLLTYYKSINILKNVEITHASIFDIFKHVDKILTISSTVGIEAQLRGLDVEWCSNTDYADFKLNEDNNKYRFINACRKYMFPLDKLYDVLMERSGNYGKNKKLSI